jgi:hypothetical protein
MYSSESNIIEIEVSKLSHLESNIMTNITMRLRVNLSQRDYGLVKSRNM